MGGGGATTYAIAETRETWTTNNKKYAGIKISGPNVKEVFKLVSPLFFQTFIPFILKASPYFHSSFCVRLNW